MKVLFYYPHINSIGGVEMAMLRLITKLTSKKGYDVYVGYRQSDSDLDLLLRFAQSKATVINLNHITQEFDIVVYCSLYCQKNIKGKRFFRWLHGCVDDMNYKMKPEPDIEKFIAVGQTCADQIPFKNKIVIFNELDENIAEYTQPIGAKSPKFKVTKNHVLRLVTVSRISPEKGFERMLEVAKRIKIPYIWDIVGNGYNKGYQDLIIKKAPKEWTFHGKQDNPYPFMKSADFLVQLSDYEAFGYVILESLVIGTPVITTNYTSAPEMVNHGKNGYIFKKDLSDFEAGLLNSRPIFEYNHPNSVDEWVKLFKSKPAK